MNDIIAALSSAPYNAAIAVIRISGSGCIDLINSILDKPLLKNNYLYTREIKTKNITDKIMAVFFSAPFSYTGEDMAEIYCHGNMLICDEIIAELIRRGARVAKGGEFTYRAFKNGKLDLVKSEAVIDLINAETTEQISYGQSRLKGEIFGGIKDIEQQLTALLATSEALINYPDEFEREEAEGLFLNEVVNKLKNIYKALEELLESYDGQRIINEGCRVAVTGKTNAGKSTLFNALLGYQRAIVTEIEGTTRDTIEDAYIYNNRKFILVDTAGIRKAYEKAEIIGIERAMEAAESADIVIYVKTSKNEQCSIKHKRLITVLNKCDSTEDCGKDYSKGIMDGDILISAKEGKNINALKQRLYDLCGSPSHSGICNARHYQNIKGALEAVTQALYANETEVISALCYRALQHINGLFGKNVSEEILDSVFSRFCVGK